jgi:cytochrome c-type biogenesis protein
MTFSLAAIFVAGLLTFASPCVLPLMPIYLATIAGGSLDRAPPRRVMVVATAFALGLSSVFVALGALASSLGGLLTGQRTAITIASGVLMVLFGLRALGVVRVALFDRDARPALARIETAASVGGAFVFGAAFALGWSPCIGPVLASVLSYTATSTASPVRGAGYLALYAAGLSLPLLLLAAVAARASSWIKRFRSAIPRLERLSGVALLGVGLWTLLGGADLLRFEAELAADLPTQTESADVASAECEADMGPGHTCALPQIDKNSGASEPAQIDGAHMLEFTSHECPICRRMRPVLDKLVAACSELRPRFVRVDVSTARGRALADEHAVRGTPTFVLFDEDGVERARLLGESSQEEVAAAVERAFGLSCWG